MSRKDLLRAVSRATGESVGYLSGLGFQLQNRFPKPIDIRDWQHLRLRHFRKLCRPRKLFRFRRC